MGCCEGVVHRGAHKQLDGEALDRLVARYDDMRKPDRQEDSTRMLLRAYEEVGFLDRNLLG